MRHRYWQRFATLFSALLLSLASTLGFAFPQQAAAVSPGSSVALDFNSLPSAQGWTYGGSDYSGNPPPADTNFFSANGSQLHMDTIGSGYFSHVYTRATAVSQSPFTLSVRARVTAYEEQSDGRNPYGFALLVLTGTEQFGVAISPVGIKGGLPEPGDTVSEHVFSPTIDTQFHDYRIEGTPGGRFELFVDGASLGTASPVPDITSSALYLGDGTRGANAQVDITAYSFEQNPAADTTPPSIDITAPASTNYLLNQSATASYTCADSGTGLASCSGPVASGTPIATGSVGTHDFTVTAADAAGNTASQTVTYTVAYKICLLYDPTKVAKKGSTIPIKIQICDVNSSNTSAATIALTAQSVTQASTSTNGPVTDSGNANPDNNFRYDPGLGGSGGYIYNLSTKPLTTGGYTLNFTVGTDPTIYTVPFQVQ